MHSFTLQNAIVYTPTLLHSFTPTLLKMLLSELLHSPNNLKTLIYNYEQNLEIYPRNGNRRSYCHPNNSWRN